MGEKLKVLQIIPYFGLAGAEIMVENLSITLKENGVNVIVISLYDYQSVITDRLESRNINVIYLNKKRGFDVNIIFRLYKLIKSENPDVIHTHLNSLPYVMIAGKMAKVPTTIHTIHNIASKETGNIQRKINYFFYKFCKVVPVAISPTVKESVIKEYNINENKVPMIFNGIELEKCIEKDKYDKNDGKINILHIGRFSEQKNHIGLIESFNIVHRYFPNTKLKLIGAGSLEDDVRDKVRELNLENCVEFLGLIENVYPYLYEADIFVLPSLWEGMPITLIEAMATGLPIVATNVGGIPDMIEDNVSGLLVEPNPQNIAESLMRLVNNYKLRQKLGRAAYMSCRKFSAKMMTKEYIKLYKNTMSAKNI